MNVYSVHVVDIQKAKLYVYLLHYSIVNRGKFQLTLFSLN